MKRISTFFAILAVAISCLLFAPTSAGAYALEEITNAQALRDYIGCRGDPCVVGDNLGGIILYFAQAAQEIKRKHTRVIFTGMCASACVVFADYVRPNACIQRGANFAVHMSFTLPLNKKWDVAKKGIPPGAKRYYPPQSPDIDAYIRSHGGYPKNGLNYISHKQALRFFPACGTKQIY